MQSAKYFYSTSSYSMYSPKDCDVLFFVLFLYSLGLGSLAFFNKLDNRILNKKGESNFRI